MKFYIQFVRSNNILNQLSDGHAGCLLNRDFLKLAFLGFVIATPVTWYLTTEGLAKFSDRIELGAGVFLLAGLAALLIALLTVSWQSIKAAISNPVNSLKNE